MRFPDLKILFAVAAFSGGACAAEDPPESSAAAAKAVAEAIGAALQADGARALALLRAVPADAFAGHDAAFLACMTERFADGEDDGGKAGEALADAVLSAYRAYWRKALTAPADRAAAEERLFATLKELLGEPVAADIDAVEPLLSERLSQAGFHSLQGRTGLLRELMAWRKQEERAYTVDLPEGPHKTTVFLLDDFVSLGWSDYATCGRRGVGGWARKEALYAVVPRYRSLDGEEFRVTFLGHETQHFADLARFPDLKPWELEYRAKLVELAGAAETRARILLKFGEDQSDDPSSPHSYANKRVLAALRERLGLPPQADLNAVDAAPLSEAALAELRADTARRQAPAP